MYGDNVIPFAENGAEDSTPISVILDWTSLLDHPSCPLTEVDRANPL
ncbi:MAG: hypothetical protein ACIARR_03170 [Phycisphaerales bacterium JB059]